MMLNLRNYTELHNQLTKLLIAIDTEFRSYSTDIYIAYNSYTQTGKLIENPVALLRYADTMVFIGTVRETYDDATSYIESTEQAADWTGIPEDELTKRAAEFTGKNIYDVGLPGINAYIRNDNDLYQKTLDQYCKWVKDNLAQSFAYKAEEMLCKTFYCEI